MELPTSYFTAGGPLKYRKLAIDSHTIAMDIDIFPDQSMKSSLANESMIWEERTHEQMAILMVSIDLLLLPDRTLCLFETRTFGVQGNGLDLVQGLSDNIKNIKEIKSFKQALFRLKEII